MFSPGKWHEKVPKDLEENLEWRRWVLEKSENNPRLQRGLKKVCRQDILFFVNTFVWQYNPQHKENEVGPFITWDFQDAAFMEILWCIENDRDLVIEKSRELGASWKCCLAIDWLCMFHDRKKFLLISRSEKAVDSPEDPDCLMWKIDFIHEHLPDWMIKGKISRRKMGMTYVETKSVITGQASTGKAGVGGRATAAFIDEFSQIDEGREVLHRTADTTKCRIFNFTHTDLDNAAYELSQRSDVRKLVLHWTMHPEKNKGLYHYDPESNILTVLDRSYEYPGDFAFVKDGSPTGGPRPGVRSPWYDAECKRRQSSRAVAMDLDINPRGATYQFFDALTIQHLKLTYCRPPCWEGELHYDQDLGKPIALMPIEGGLLKMWRPLNNRGLPVASQYSAGADISWGTGSTPSCLSIMDGRTGEKVLEYVNALVDPTAFAGLCVSLCRLFCDENDEGAWFCWECQGPGVPFGRKVVELGYRNIYFRTNEHSLRNEISDTPGWVPIPNNKVQAMQDYRGALYTRTYLNYSEAALDECLSFIHKNGTIEHGGSSTEQDPSGATVNHGDIVIADVLSWKMGKSMGAIKKKQEPEIKVGSLAWRRQLRENTRRNQEWDPNLAGV